MKSFHVGCGPIPTRRKNYFDRFSALEVNETWHQPIGLDVLREWRREAGSDAHIAMHVWRWIVLDNLEANSPPPEGLSIHDVGMLQVTEANATLWKRVVEQAEALEANAVWMRTPASLSPSMKNRERMEKFQNEIIGDVPFRIYWEARGMWEPEVAQEFADSLGWQLVIDPYQEFELPEATGEHGVYVHHQPRGRKNFDRDDCEDLLDIYEEHEGDVVAIFRGSSRERNAQRMVEAYQDRNG